VKTEVRSLSFPALKIKQPIGDFYVGVIPSNKLWEIAYSDVRRMEKREVESYFGIERPLKEDRVKAIKEFVRTKDASFPTAIILAVTGECAMWDEEKSQLTLCEFIPDSEQLKGGAEAVPFEKVGKILDGQHRIAGLEGYDGPTFQCNVSIFVDADIAEQANIFATVNLAQTKVNKSLVYDLFELAKARSPQKTCHNIAVALDRLETSPFCKRIKRLGVATDGRFNETITQATFVESLLRHMSKKPNEDRDLLLRGKKLSYPTNEDLRKLIFRGLFVEEKDDEISKIVWTYFSSVAKKWPKAWENFDRGNILNKTNGFKALMRFLRPAYLSLADKAGKQVAVNAFDQLFKKVSLKETDFTIENFPPGSSGEAALLVRLFQDTGLPRD